MATVAGEIMLRGVQAFEARWLAVRSQHPTTRDDNTVIAHAMGQLIDQYQTPAQIETELPDHLKSLFRELATAYFRGYIPAQEAAAEPAAAPVTVAHGADHTHREISAAVEKVRTLAQNSRCSVNAGPKCRPDDPSEAETLIIEFPEGWPQPE